MRYRHPFDGDGAVTSVALRGGRAHAKRAFVRTTEFVEETAADAVLYRNTFGTQRTGRQAAERPNAFDVRQRNVANTNVVVWGASPPRCLALWEAAQPWELSPDSLATVGRQPTDLGGLLAPGLPFGTGSPPLDAALRAAGLGGGEAFTAHPHVDAAAGRLLGFKYTMLPAAGRLASGELPVETVMTLLELSPDWAVASSATLMLPGYGFVHDFGFTASAFAVFQNPVTLDMTPFLLGAAGPAEGLSFRPDRRLALHLVPRRGGRPARRVEMEGPSGFVFHIANAWDTADGGAVVDAVVMDDVASIAELASRADFTDAVFSGSRHTLRRIVVPPPGAGAGALARSLPAGTRLTEFPKINPAYAGRRHRYVYMVGSRRADMGEIQPLQMWIKLDMAPLDAMAATPAGASQSAGSAGSAHAPEAVCDFGRRGYAQEPEFVPRPGGTAEDDGWLVGFVYDAGRHASGLAVVDAATMTRVAVAWLRGGPLPPGLHGSWSPTVFGWPAAA